MSQEKCHIFSVAYELLNNRPFKTFLLIKYKNEGSRNANSYCLLNTTNLRGIDYV